MWRIKLVKVDGSEPDKWLVDVPEDNNKMIEYSVDKSLAVSWPIDEIHDANLAARLLASLSETEGWDICLLGAADLE